MARTPFDPFDPNCKPESGWRERLYTVIFQTETRGGRAFDACLLIAIVLSVAVVCLETVESIDEVYGRGFLIAEWVLTGLFTVEYILRLICVTSARRYALSFFGIIDLIAVLPMFIGLVVADAASLQIVRALRLMRVFRVLKLGNFLRDARVLSRALSAARYKIAVFMVAVINLVLLQGALMYLVEGPAHGFTSIPQSVYWAIVTMTTVGYGDMAPSTPMGQALASLVMLMGYAVIAVPTGIVTAELTRARLVPRSNQAGHRCSCGTDEPDLDAKFCRSCGQPLSTLEDAHRGESDPA